jgi:osmotically-inducible protein OsmY
MTSDADIQRRALSQLSLRRPCDEDEDVSACVHEGIVRLSGFTCSYCEKNRIEDAVRQLAGVAGVVNEIEVRLRSHERLSDAELECEARRAIATEVPAVSGRVTATVRGGQVVLRGIVPYHFLRERSESAVRRLAGVTVIHNEIQVEAAAIATEVRRSIGARLSQKSSDEARQVSVETNGPEVTLRGRVATANERHLIEQAVWAVPGVAEVRNHIIVSSAA